MRAEREAGAKGSCEGPDRGKTIKAHRAVKSFEVREWEHTPAHHLRRPAQHPSHPPSCMHPHKHTGTRLHTRLSRTYAPSGILRREEGEIREEDVVKEGMATATTTTRRHRSDVPSRMYQEGTDPSAGLRIRRLALRAEYHDSMTIAGSAVAKQDKSTR
ncbi:hypothetical protein FIBSPDRAFT_934159 [Athelia psychrophila]|uniref:Uncharacterized protein n=1 Tax=Athelia psychrophila TaxID=1759441 RepID=A0A166FU65_9AGAM|nr:hypothetical protein FIBSPDRAFT_934159 [Fibularhizoctonia sp. CBS 109695]